MMIDVEEKIRCLESTKHQYVCVYCANKNFYETNSAEEFYEHIIHVHSDLKQLNCVFCDLNISAQFYTDHYEQHISPNCISHAYNCSNCSLQTNLQKRFLQHDCCNPSSTTTTTYNCQHCGLKFLNKEALTTHISDFLSVVVECTYPNCMVKSISTKAIRQHLVQKHQATTLQFMSSSHIYCKSTGVLPRSTSLISSSISQAVIQNALMTALLGGLPESTRQSSLPPSNDCASRCIFICPCCRDFVSGSDTKFDAHLKVCLVNLEGGCGALNYNVYWCGSCRTVASTSRNYVEEHFEESHSDDIKSKDTIKCESRRFSPSLSQNRSAPHNSRSSTKRCHEDAASDDQSLNDYDSCKKQRRLSHPSHDSQTESSASVLEQVKFPIDYVALRTNYPNHLNDPFFTSMLEILEKFSSYTIDIVNREGNRRIPRCPKCFKVFNYGLSDFKRHLMCVHHGCDRNTARHYLRYLGIETLSTQSDTDQQSTNSTKPLKDSSTSRSNSQLLSDRNINFSSNNLQDIHLEYSPTVLSKIIACLPQDLQADLKVKMKIYGSKYVKWEQQSDGKRYYCVDCSYVSAHALADVRKHVLGSHCGISTKQFRFCLQASRLDPVNFKLLPDDELLRLANELFRRKQRSVDHCFFISKEDRMNNESSNSSLENNNTIPCVDDSNDLDLSLNDDSITDQFNSISNFKEIVFPLKYSDSVLANLLTPLMNNEDYQSIVEQMNVYASYKITRIENGDRTIAFRCPCNRVFYSEKQSNSHGRRSTLADCRRHVLGVHAKIPPQYITACSQASRMSKETNYELYADSTLLKYASESPLRAGIKSITEGSNSPVTRDRIITTPVISSIRNQNNFNSLRTNGHAANDKNVERVVDLPFSKPALESLLEGLCSPDFVHNIINKMEIYSGYQIRVLRIHGKRVYACSGCPSTSPHGMTDIRKHILGVHAKVPEKFKNVCMQASRLNRDDSSLLSDANIFVMAGVKHKDSTVKRMISSSNEIDDEMDSVSQDEGLMISMSNQSPPVFPEFEFTMDSQIEVVNPEPVSDTVDLNGFYPELDY